MANGTWKIARNRSGAQLPIALLAALAIALILIGKAQNPIFDRARTTVTDWASPVLRIARAPLDGLDRWMGSIGEIFNVYQENLRLKDENARLRQWRNAAVALEDRVKRYQLLLRAVPDPKLSSVMARVIGRSNQPFLQTMILDAGKAQGVKPGQAVIDQRGMIGRIFMAGDNSGAPLLDLLSQRVVLKPGAQVVSSGDGGLLPPGLAIGTVVGNSVSGYRVVLLADPGASDDVNIVDFKLKTEQPPATTANELPATAAALPPAAPPQPAPVAAPLVHAAAPVVKPPTALPASPPAKPSANAQEPPASDTGNE